jgi:probable DNA repair protein
MGSDVDALLPERAYKAGMGTSSGPELDAWLSAGGLVVTASDRAARAVLSAYHRARQNEALSAWAAPQVVSWQTFVRGAWEKRTSDARLVLNPLQERSIWLRNIEASSQPAALLVEPRRRLAELAMRAHALICAYSPQYLEPRTRAGWDQDAGAWCEWLVAFDAACTQIGAISPDRIPIELASLLDAGETRPPLLLAGFDRLTLAHRMVLDVWGEWRQVSAGPFAESVAFYRAADLGSELAACAAWCKQVLSTAPERRVLVVSQSVTERRGEIERAFLRQNEHGAGLRFEFSLGVPLGSLPVARSAEMLLRWLDGSLEEQELDWLFASGHTAASERETADLQAAMRIIRRRKRQRALWKLRTFLVEASSLSRSWANRMLLAQERLQIEAQRERTPLEWAELASHLLEAAGWPGAQPQSSAEFQAARRWNQVLETCGSLGFDGRRMRWNDFFAEVRAEMAGTLFAPESQDASVVIAGPAESAGLEADSIWFLGADENSWPATGEAHPLLPTGVQREAHMPHASPALDWELSQIVTQRLLASAPEMRFSYAAQVEGSDARASRLVTQFAGAPQPMSAELSAAPAPAPIALAYEDTSRVPLEMPGDVHQNENTATTSVSGGAGVITSQSQCPFKAFATARLKAETWEPAELSLTPAERGELIHAVLHAVWAGPPRGVRSLDELRAVADPPAFVAEHARNAINSGIPARVRDEMPARHLALEEQRLAGLVSTWLQYELTRANFCVEQTEVEKHVGVAGLPLRLRLDRLDRLNDDSFLVIDYKTGDVSEHAWDLPRAEDLQLPLYAGFGLEQGQEAGGLVFAKVRAGDMCFAGRMGDATATLLSTLGPRSALVKNPFEAEQLIAWREEIERLARDFLAGRADVDPRDPPKTCERCGLYTLCRIQERGIAFDEAGEDADD